MYYRALSYYFVFSSRRRHTRFKCDWSSDVCSSDLSSRRFATPGSKNSGWSRNPSSVERRSRHRLADVPPGGHPDGAALPQNDRRFGDAPRCRLPPFFRLGGPSRAARPVSLRGGGRPGRGRGVRPPARGARETGREGGSSRFGKAGEGEGDHEDSPSQDGEGGEGTRDREKNGSVRIPCTGTREPRRTHQEDAGEERLRGVRPGGGGDDPAGEGSPFGGPPDRGARRAPDRLFRRPPRPQIGRASCRERG